ncbi:MAG TPA: proton-translocating NADH-quinone oxidoreductase subunit M [Planctomycetaceae bacterium]|nr:proton-translocating NADH-quinone oxidoreductase subunit M [Planctomycetaceae bacterium]|tara:strand:- start:288 stop:2030 length:1743 start_codon:yes stop_codon:yes gene_type:complete
MLDLKLLLLVTLFVPLVGVGVIWVVAPLGDRAVRWIALLVASVSLICSTAIVFSSEAATQAELAVTDVAWLANSSVTPLDVRFHVGLDGLSLWMFGLSPLLTLTAILVSWEAIRDRVALFYGMLLLLEFGCVGVFVARDIVLFYVFFEFTLIPLFFLVGVWGSEQRQYAAVKFFLFTLAGSVLTLLGLLAIVVWNANQWNGGTWTFSIPDLSTNLRLAASEGNLPVKFQLMVFLALFAGFAIKVPLFPLHTWLPLAHVQAPAAGSVMLAGVLLKIGTYGFVRFGILMLPDAILHPGIQVVPNVVASVFPWVSTGTVFVYPWLLSLAVIGIVYGALVALAQDDFKRLIAYSSVSHMGFCVLGLFALNRPGLQGGTLQMVNHGISTGALFALVGMIYERYHTREISALSGLAKRLPILSFFMLLFTFSSIGLPGLNGFAGEVLVLLGMFQRAWSQSIAGWQPLLIAVAVLAVSGVVLGAWYMLYLVQRVFFGPLKEPAQHAAHAPACDLSPREILAVAPLAILVVWIGVAPGFFLSRTAQTLNDVEAVAENAFTRHHEDYQRLWSAVPKVTAPAVELSRRVP